MDKLNCMYSSCKKILPLPKADFNSSCSHKYQQQVTSDKIECITMCSFFQLSAALTRRERQMMLVILLLLPLFVVVRRTRCEWVDYPSSMGRCCSVIPVEACEPEEAVTNRACRDVCHYGGCRKGGQCEYVGLLQSAKACRCNC
ncbi:hypothetical protein Cni_G15750 [Canna indica]|uniref:Uncharacterized protein n=1 Tax=Canna indica TaxID=4628 RepID=A0AAQ3KED4_9LILI|nr:hypothetical protein Cni_G15750 [Canna indica]